MKAHPLKVFNYKRLPGVGPGTYPARGTVVDLLLDVPYMLRTKVIPPLRILNQFLKTGIDYAGMSGGVKWKPFQLSRAEYINLIRDLLTNGDNLSSDERRRIGKNEFEWKTIDPPIWVRTYSDWQHWVSEFRYGPPGKAKRFINAQRNCESLNASYKMAMKKGDFRLAAKLFQKCNRAAQGLAVLECPGPIKSIKHFVHLQKIAELLTHVEQAESSLKRALSGRRNQ